MSATIQRSQHPGTYLHFDGGFSIDNPNGGVLAPSEEVIEGLLAAIRGFCKQHSVGWDVDYHIESSEHGFERAKRIASQYFPVTEVS